MTEDAGADPQDGMDLLLGANTALSDAVDALGVAQRALEEATMELLAVVGGE